MGPFHSLFLGFFWPYHTAWGILVPRPGIEPSPGCSCKGAKSKPVDFQGIPSQPFLNIWSFKDTSSLSIQSLCDWKEQVHSWVGEDLSFWRSIS